MTSGLMGLQGRKIVVTGASRGLGRGMALQLAAAGADLVLTARAASSAEETAESVRALGARCTTIGMEVGQGSQPIEAAAEKIWRDSGGVDAVFNNAGVTLLQPALETTDEAWNEMLNVNLSSVFYTCRSFGRRMLAGGGGKLVNVASDIGIRGEAGWSAYSASKGGVVSLSKSLAWEWAPKVTVNVIAPGPFYTDANRPAFDIPEVMASVEQRVPLGRVGDPEAHLGPLAVLLAGTGSDFMTGAVFRVDGGICRS